MKSTGELGRPGPGQAAIELVSGPHDGERFHHRVETTTMQPPVEIDRSGKVSGGRTVTYWRRTGPERCHVDGAAVWHYDAHRPEPDIEAQA